jgi:pimeloyl-ACP methyl ester carboxylesterase
LAITPEQQLAQIQGEAQFLSTPLGDGTLNWQRWSGPAGELPLLLLHGGFGSWTHWLANIQQLRKTRTLWTLDLPGLGSSADMPEPHSVDHFAEIILQSLNTLQGGDSQFDLVGFSFGALVGAHLAAASGHRCRHFIACGAAGFGDLHVQVELQRPPARTMSVDDANRIHRANLSALMFSPEAVIDDMALKVHGNNLAMARFGSRGLSRGSGFTEVLPQITARLCGIWGSEDATAGGLAAIARREALFRRSQPNCSFHILEGIGHWAMYEDADTFNRVLLEELALA